MMSLWSLNNVKKFIIFQGMYVFKINLVFCKNTKQKWLKTKVIESSNVIFDQWVSIVGLFKNFLLHILNLSHIIACNFVHIEVCLFNLQFVRCYWYPNFKTYAYLSKLNLVENHCVSLVIKEGYRPTNKSRV